MIEGNIPQISIRVYEKDSWVKKNLMDATPEERLLWYYMQSKGQIANVLERFIEFNKEDINVEKN